MTPESFNALDDHGPRILVVEDTVIVAVELERMLREAGCRVVGPLNTLEQALQAADREDLQGALLDLNLHGRSSLPAADALMERGVPVVLVTGYSVRSLPEKYRSLLHLEKPFTRAEFMRAIAEGFGCRTAG